MISFVGLVPWIMFGIATSSYLLFHFAALTEWMTDQHSEQASIAAGNELNV